MKRLINKLKRIFNTGPNQRRVAARLKAGESLTTRKDLQSLLASPALLNDLEVVGLQKYAARAPKTIVEIGAAYGGSSLLFLLGKNSGVEVNSIDPFVVDSMGAFQATVELCFSRVTKALTLLGQADRIANWTLIPKFSFDAAKDWLKPIDVLFIDGDHHYEAVKKDFNDWFPFVNRGGFILFHDSCRPDQSVADQYDHGWPGPTQVAKELAEDSRVKLVEQIYSLSVFRKN